MREELVQKISEKTGLSPDKAPEVVDVVVSHLKERLPAPLASGLDSLLAGSSSGGGNLADEAKSVISGLSSMFGAKA
jgi:hypothetical protein